MQDTLGDRVKSQYEDRTRYSLPRRTYTIIRLDGKAFHTYTRGLEKPFDKGLFEDMDAAIIAMLPEIQGAQFAYTQSDEISILLTDFAQPTTSAWFDGNLQKMCSVAASIITAEFNKVRARRWGNAFRANMLMSSHGMDEEACDHGDTKEFQLAYFDARVFTIPDPTEVMNYFIWRNQDCSRNSVSMVAQSLYSHKELHGKNTTEKHEMIHQAGKNWATDYTDGEKNGRIIIKETYVAEAPKGYDSQNNPIGLVERTRWVSKGAWKFTENKEQLAAKIPRYE